jgi:hypothetical protein
MLNLKKKFINRTKVLNGLFTLLINNAEFIYIYYISFYDSMFYSFSHRRNGIFELLIFINLFITIISAIDITWLLFFESTTNTYLSLPPIKTDPQYDPLYIWPNGDPYKHLSDLTFVEEEIVYMNNITICICLIAGIWKILFFM